MARVPAWGFDLDAGTRRVLATGLAVRTAPVSDDRPLGPDAWARLRSQTAHHCLDGLLVAAVADRALASTADQRAELAGLEVGLTRFRMWHEQRLAEVVDLLDRAGVATRVLKGPALAELDYPDAQLRPTSDVDLLVRGAEIDRAVAVLVGEGGVRTDPDPVPGFAATVGKGATVAMPGGMEVDLHRLLVWGPLGVRLPPDELWRTGRGFERGGRRFETLGVEETLLHACAHLLVLGWRRALTARDVIQVLGNPALDPDRAIFLARRWDAEALLATGVLLSRREVGIDDDAVAAGAPVLGWARGYVPRWRDRLWLRVERPDDPLGPIEALATYGELRTRAERRMLRAATLHPAPGTYPSPGQRVGRVLRRTGARLTGAVDRRAG